MKNFTKQFANKTLFKPTRWLLVALMFLLGTVSALAIDMTGGEVVFLKPGTNWKKDGARFAVYFFNNSTNKNTWVSMTATDQTDIYYATVPSGTWKNLIFCRMNGGNATNEWGNKWNQTADLTFDGKKNLFTVSNSAWDNSSTTWSTKLFTSNGKLTASSTSINIGDEVTLTPSLADYTTYNTLKSTSYSIDPDTGAEISGNTFTATSAGEYKVTATITYNAKGCADNIGTATDNVTITVVDPCTLPSKIEIKGATTPCANSTQTYEATVTEGSGYDLEWTVPTGYTINSVQGTTINVTVGTAQGNIVCTAKCGSNTKPSDNYTVTPYSTQVPEIELSNNYICPSESATITIKNPELNVSTLAYRLYNSEDVKIAEKSQPTAAPVTFIVSNEGTYYVTVSHTCGGGKTSNEVTLYKYATPELPKYTPVAATQCNDTPNKDGSVTLNNPIKGNTYANKIKTTRL